jgi:pimeloyl-ACP methyl ester carboxylesterase
VDHAEAKPDFHPNKGHTMKSLGRKKLFATISNAGVALLAATLLVNPNAAAAHRNTAITVPGAGDQARRVQCRSIKVDGVRIFYREAGDPNLPTILLLHGFSSSSHMFRDLMPLLSDRFHVVAPDYPGFGYSDAPPANEFEPTFSNLETVVEHFVQEIGLHSFVIYMQDFGGPVGFRLAVKHPEWIKGLIIQNANAYQEGLVVPPAKENTSSDITPVQPTSMKVVNPGFITYMYKSGARNPSSLNPDAWTVDIAALSNPEARRIQSGLIDDYVSNIQLYSQWQIYLKERQPRTLVVWGKNDRGFLPAGAEAYRRDIPDVTVEYFDTGHFALEEDVLPIAQAIVTRFAKKR